MVFYHFYGMVLGGARSVRCQVGCEVSSFLCIVSKRSSTRDAFLDLAFGWQFICELDTFRDCSSELFIAFAWQGLIHCLVADLQKTQFRPIVSFHELQTHGLNYFSCWESESLMRSMGLLGIPLLHRVLPQIACKRLRTSWMECTCSIL